MAIGADAPDFTVSCIRNITFENVNITKGIRAAYIKTLKSNNGTGIIDNITFR
jgi:polygalacturonase